MVRLAKIVSALSVLICAPALAQTSDAVRIGVLADMAGVYSDDQGPGSVVGAQLAVEDYGGKAARLKVGPARHAPGRRCYRFVEGGPHWVQCLASTNKSLAQMNKSRNGDDAT